MPSFICIEYGCAVCGQRFDSLEDRAEPAASLPHCGQPAPRVVSAPMGRVRGTEVIRGESDRPPPGAMDTSALADGMPYKEWRAQEDGPRKDEHRKAMGVGAQQYSIGSG